VAIQHRNDIVPKLGLKANPLVENIVTVERVLPISTPINVILEAHDVSNYAETAKLADKSQEIGLKGVREQVLDLLPKNGIGVQNWAETTVYQPERID
jgi:hypothetical protein